MEELRTASELNSSEAVTHFRLAESFHNLGLIKNAILEYKRAIEIDPSMVAAYDGLGWIEMNMGHTAEAIKTWKKIIEIKGSNIDVAYNIAWAYNDIAHKMIKNHRISEAKRYWRLALQYNPGNKESKYYLRKY